MTGTAKKNKDEAMIEVSESSNETNEKICFIMMPIADHPSYTDGHFQRVYDYLIKPACAAAGLKPYRADDNNASDMIMLDILQKLVECDMAICDISSRNANVFFELGLRQAFNKKTILITDGTQNPPFDISGLRHVPYSPSLRVDTVANEVPKITKMLIETEKLTDDKVNSIVQLLQIKPAEVNTKELPPLDSVVYDMFSQLKEQLNTLSPKDNVVTSSKLNSRKKIDNFTKTISSVTPGLIFEKIYDKIDLYFFDCTWEIKNTGSDNEESIILGMFEYEDGDELVFRDKRNTIHRVYNTRSNRMNIFAL